MSNVPRPPYSLVAGLPCLVVPFGMCLTGYGAYLRMGSLVLIPALIGTGFLGIYAVRGMGHLWRGRFNADLVNPRSDRGLLMIFLGFAAFSWTAGQQIRSWYCWSIVARSEPAIDALQKYHAAHGRYPSSLGDVPDFMSRANAAGITVGQGRVGRFGVDLRPLDQQDVTVYLDSGGYFCVVPLEKKLPMSFTRFYILRRDSASQGWSLDHLVWSLAGI